MLRREGLTWSLIRFSLPIIGCGLVQQAFNSIDVAVVGRMVSSSALAAVGANGPVISLIITLFMGLGVGINVVVSRALGERNYGRVRRTVATQAVVSAAVGIILLLTGLAVARPLLAALDTPAEILEAATSYLQIYALGFPAMLAYNFSSAVLRSVGDTFRPFLWLVAGGVVNLCLNLVFVCVFGMGVEGVAIATSVSNYVSAAGVIWILSREKGSIRLQRRHLRFYGAEFAAIVRIGLPAGVQGTLFALSNVIIQSAINLLGPDAMAGSAAAITYELYGYFIISAFVQAATAYVGINYGAGQYSNCRIIVWRCVALSALFSFVLNTAVVCFSTAASQLLTGDGASLEYAVMRIQLVLFWQFVASSYEVCGGALRALGYSILPMLITLGGTCVVRIWWVRLSGFTLDYTRLLSVYPATWCLTGVVMVIAYCLVARRAYSRDPI